jgi:hypothetical protein
LAIVCERSEKESRLGDWAHTLATNLKASPT